MDTSKSVIELSAARLTAHHEGGIVVKLADSRGYSMPPDQPTPDIVPAIILPSGRKQAVQVSSPESDSSKLVILFFPAESGAITLELSSHGVSFRSRISVSLGIFFDPQKCHSAIILSKNNRVVTHGSGAAYCNVLATEGYTTGQHEWALRVIKGTVDNCDVAFRVTPSPSDGNYNSIEPFFGHKVPCWRGWRASGFAINLPFMRFDQSAAMQRVLDEDDLVFTLDCDARTLQCLNLRTQEAKKFTDIDGSKPLYPAVTTFCKGHSVEMMYCS